MKRAFSLRNTLALLCLSFLVGCGTTGNVLIPGMNHTVRVESYRSAIATGNTSRMESGARDALRRTNSQDGVLFALEAARLQSVAGRHPESIRSFHLATDIFDQERAAPSISLSRTFFSASALATNDLAIPYRSQSFERLMAYNYLALEFLITGELDRAQIALTAAQAEQAFLREREEDWAEAARRQSEQNRLGWSAQQEALRGHQQQFQVDHTVLEPYQSALTYYLAGLLFEARGEPDRAAIALRQAAGLLPRNPYIDRAVSDLPRRQDAYSARLVVLANDGLISARDTIAIPFIWNETILMVAMPVFSSGSPPIRPLQVRSGGVSLGNTAMLAHLDGQARKTLSQQYPAIFTRQVLRLIAKYQTQRRLAEESPWAGFAAQIFNLLTDKADLRGWLTLPAYVQGAHFDLAPGAHRIELGSSLSLNLELPPHSTTFIILNRVGNHVSSQVVTFDANGNPVDSSIINRTPSP